MIVTADMFTSAKQITDPMQRWIQNIAEEGTQVRGGEEGVARACTYAMNSFYGISSSIFRFTIED